MKRWERWSLNLSALAVIVTGAVYTWMKYVVINDDPFAVVNHPWQPAMLDAHLLVAPTFILIFGIVLNSHVMKKLRATKIPNRKSGFVALGTFVLMTISGYGLQVVTDDFWLNATVILHLASGAIFSVTYAGHLWISVRLVRTARSPIRDVA
jgi:hypothetical protein